MNFGAEMGVAGIPEHPENWWPALEESRETARALCLPKIRATEGGADGKWINSATKMGLSVKLQPIIPTVLPTNHLHSGMCLCRLGASRKAPGLHPPAG